MWFSWIIDFGKSGPDRGQGGKYLIVGPDYDGPLPEGGYFVAHSKTNRILYASRAYLVDNDPKPAIENIKANLKIYPYGLVRPRTARRRGARQLDPRPTRRRAGSPSCASTARRRRSSASPGGRARSRLCNERDEAIVSPERVAASADDRGGNNRSLQP